MMTLPAMTTDGSHSSFFARSERPLSIATKVPVSSRIRWMGEGSPGRTWSLNIRVKLDPEESKASVAGNTATARTIAQPKVTKKRAVAFRHSSRLLSLSQAGSTPRLGSARLGSARLGSKFSLAVPMSSRLYRLPPQWHFTRLCPNIFRGGFRNARGRANPLREHNARNHGTTGSTQFSSRSPSTRANSRRLLVANTASMLKACAAIKVSSEPMGLPLASSLARSSP